MIRHNFKYDNTLTLSSPLDYGTNAQLAVLTTNGCPSALNGLGRVMVLRDDLDQAEKFMHRAVEAEPNFRPAKDELKKIENGRRSRPGR